MITFSKFIERAEQPLDPERHSFLNRDVRPFPTNPSKIDVPFLNPKYEIKYFVLKDYPEIAKFSKISLEKLKTLVTPQNRIAWTLVEKQEICGYIVLELNIDNYKLISINASSPKQEKIKSMLGFAISKLEDKRRTKFIINLKGNCGLEVYNSLKQSGFIAKPLPDGNIEFTHHHWGDDWKYT